MPFGDWLPIQELVVASLPSTSAFVQNGMVSHGSTNSAKVTNARKAAATAGHDEDQRREFDRAATLVSTLDQRIP
jgi:hypothetical protein